LQRRRGWKSRVDNLGDPGRLAHRERSASS
jgi:hypothetical protein